MMQVNLSKSCNNHKIFVRGHKHIKKLCKIIIIFLLESPEIRYVTKGIKSLIATSLEFLIKSYSSSQLIANLSIYPIFRVSDLPVHLNTSVLRKSLLALRRVKSVEEFCLAE